MITIVNYGLGNLGSIQNMLKRLGYSSEITDSKDKIKEAKKIILPGVGRFDAAMNKINDLDLKETLDFKALVEKTPILGICLGMQLLTNHSEEGNVSGFGWIDANVKRFQFTSDKMFKIPHMGWNEVFVSNNCPLTDSMDDTFKYYFVHSYYVSVKNSQDSFLKCDYGIKFDAGIYHENIFGVQFHPEKSHKYGKILLNNFARL